MKKSSLVLGFLIMMVLSVNVVSYAKVTVDTSKSSEGYITVNTDKELTKRIKVRIIKGTEQVTHDLIKVNEDVPYALTFGDGNYEIKIFENQKDNLYSVIQTKKVNVTIKDEDKVYLNSTNEVNWNENNEVIKLAKELTKDLTTDEEKIKVIYDYVVNNYTYDFAKVNGLPTTYKPNLDQVYNAKKGICYDYSVMFASMLRSVGVPAKLVKGYSLTDINTYHAWNEVKVNGEWKTIDTTNDSYAIANGREVTMFRDPNSFIVSNRY